MEYTADKKAGKKDSRQHHQQATGIQPGKNSNYLCRHGPLLGIRILFSSFTQCYVDQDPLKDMPAGSGSGKLSDLKQRRDAELIQHCPKP